MSPETHYVDTGSIPWRRSPYDGVEWKKLEFDRSTGASSVLLRFAPGASYGAHRHPDGERYLVLEGSLEDGGKTWERGTFVSHPPGSAHAPSSKEGCLLFVTLPSAIEMIAS